MSSELFRKLLKPKKLNLTVLLLLLIGAIGLILTILGIFINLLRRLHGTVSILSWTCGQGLRHNGRQSRIPAALTSLTACSSGADKAADDKGSVYYLSFKPEQDQIWQDVAKAYTEETGVEVKVVTAASGPWR